MEALGKLDGVEHVDAGWATNTGIVALAPGKTLDIESAREALAGTGFRVLSLTPR